MLLTTLIACAAARAGRPQTRRLEGTRTGYALDDDTIRKAVTLWFSNRTAAEAKYGPISMWDTSGVTDMSYLFCGTSFFSSLGCNTAAASFNDDIGAWDTSGVTSMRWMFWYASAFNQDIGGWTADNVTNMRSMFSGASSFDQPIGDWQVDKVKSMEHMFFNASSFNHPNGDWSVGAVTNMRGMFTEASSFNQPIANWDISSVKEMDGIFHRASAFNQVLGWCITQSLPELFEGAKCEATYCGAVAPGTCTAPSAVAAEYCKLNDTSVCWGAYRNFVQSVSSLADMAAADYSAPALADLDGDGLSDLGLGQSDGTLSFYRNVDMSFQQVVGANDPFAGINVGGHAAPAFADLTNDGLLDLVIGSEASGIAFYANTGTASAPEFTKVSNSAGLCGDELVPVTESECPDNPEKLVESCDLVPCGQLCEGDGECGTDSGLNNCIKGDDNYDVYWKRCDARQGPFAGIDLTGSFTAPALFDVDVDGDLDLLVGQKDGSFTYYRNDGTQEAANFTKVERIDEDPFFDVAAVSGFSKPMFLDLVGDGRQDLIVGDESGVMTSYRNVGSVSNPIYVKIADNPLAVASGRSFAAPTFARLDGVASIVVGSAPGTLALYKEAAKLTFSAVSPAEDPFTGIDVTGYSYPALADLGEGTLDLVVGERLGTLQYYRNIGTPSQPMFRPAENSPFEDIDCRYSAPAFTDFDGCRHSAPAFADLDGDGRLELVVGAMSPGNFSYYRNAGARFEKVEGLDNPFYVVNLDGAQTSSTRSNTLALADIDGDDDLDLLVGDATGTVHFYQNVGTPSAPIFERVDGAENPFRSVIVDGYSAPTFADVDRDGLIDLVVGGDRGLLSYFRNEGTRFEPRFQKIDGAAVNPFHGIDVGQKAKPTFADLDDDGLPDLVIGNAAGELTYIKSSQYCAMMAGDFPCSGNGICVDARNGILEDATCHCPFTFVQDSQCEKCLPGYYSFFCIPCGPNTFSTGGVPLANDECTPCPEDYYSGISASTCTKCPAGQRRSPNEPACRRVGKNKSRKNVRKQRNIAIAVVSVLVACLLLLGYFLRRYRRRQTKLEHERSEIVQEQVTAARDQVQEFQAHFVTISGKRFMSFDKLYPQEELRDELIVYDSVADVRDASTRGEVFVFLSHPVWKSKFYCAFVLNLRVDLHAIDAAPARWRGDAGSSPLDGANTAVHPTHWLIST